MVSSTPKTSGSPSRRNAVANKPNSTEDNFNGPSGAVQHCMVFIEALFAFQADCPEGNLRQKAGEVVITKEEQGRKVITWRREWQRKALPPSFVLFSLLFTEYHRSSFIAKYGAAIA